MNDATDHDFAGHETATRPDVPAATRPDVPAATRPDVPVATRPDVPVATRPDVPAARQPPSSAPRTAVPLHPAPRTTAPLRPAPRTAMPLRPAFPLVPALEVTWRGPKGPARRRALTDLAARCAASLGRALEAACVVDALEVGVPGALLAGATFGLHLADTGEAAGLRLSPEFAAAAVCAVTGAEVPVLAGAPDRITAAVIGHALLAGLYALAEDGLGHALVADGDDLVPALAVTVRLRLGGRPGALQLLLGPAAAAALASDLAPHSRPDLGTCAGLPAGARLCAGPLRLAAHTVRALAPGDAVCVDPTLRLAPLPAGPAHLALGHRGRVAHGRLQEGRFTVTGFGPAAPTFTEESTMPSDLLQLDLRVVLADVPLTLAEAADLDVGSVVPLPSAEPTVRLLVADSCIATGELVDVDGVLGVRLLARSPR